MRTVNRPETSRPLLRGGSLSAHFHRPLAVWVAADPARKASFMYRYDFFVSHKREPRDSQLITPWLSKVLERIEYWVRQDLGGRSVGLFIDTKNIEAGDAWPDTIRDALLSSACLLPIWSHEYFHSTWCVAEWRSFRSRERLIADREKSACKLIVPIKFHDGQWFPPEAARVQQFDLSRYAATTIGFWDTKRADELDQLLMTEVAPVLAEAVRNAPPFESDWPVDLPDHHPPPPPSDVKMVRL
jgi:TIR domain